LRSKPLAGRHAKNPDGISRCNAAGRSLGTTRAGDEPAGGLANETKQGCPVEGAHERLKAVRGTNGEARRASPSNTSQREQSGRARSAVATCRVVGVAEARMRRNVRRLGDRCGRTTAACRPGRQLVREQLERVGQFQRPRRQQFGRHDDIVRRIHWPLLLGCIDVKPLPNDPRRAAAILDRLDPAKDQFGVRLAEAEGTHDKRAIRWNATRL